MRHGILALALSLLTAAMPALAEPEDTPLDRLTRFEERLGWEAIGRVDIDGIGFCTGVLIAPDLVLTAAHCLVRKPGMTVVDPSKIAFKAGYSDGKAVTIRRAQMTVTHPDYIDETSDHYDSVQSDVGLIKLESPIPTTIASPFAIGEQRVGSEVSVVSYARGRSEALSWQRSCSVRGKADGMAAFSCDVTYGSSGAPVFDTSGRRPQIVSLISRGYRENGESVVFGPIIQGPVAELKEALRTSKGVNMIGGGVASVVQASKGARFVKAGEGARFVRP